MWPFRRKKQTQQLIKRDFSNVPWKWIFEEGARTHHCFKFSNGLGMIVFKDSSGTFDGMEAHAVERFNDDGSFKILWVPELKFYNRRYGIGVEEVEEFKNQIRAFRRYV